MNIKRDWIPSRLLSLGIALGLLHNPSVLAQTIRVSQSSVITVSSLSENSIFAAPPPPTDYGEPGGRTSAGSRNCSVSNLQTAQLTALVPIYKTEGEAVTGGLTTRSNPTFWFYVPFKLQPENTMEFVLKDAAENYIYQTKIPGEATSEGIVKLSLPPKLKLRENQSYRWHFLLYCNSKTPAKFVSGYIKRVIRPNLERQLVTATPREQVHLYGKAGIWYDAFTQLANLYRQNPKDKHLQQDWISLMQDIQLAEVVEAPFSPCCVQPN